MPLDFKVQSYKGKPVEPKLTIQVNGKSLKADKDYIVTYTGNTLPNDKAIATVVGIGNYSGTVNKEFVIDISFHVHCKVPSDSLYYKISTTKKGNKAINAPKRIKC